MCTRAWESACRLSHHSELCVNVCSMLTWPSPAVRPLWYHSPLLKHSGWSPPDAHRWNDWAGQSGHIRLSSRCIVGWMGEALVSVRDRSQGSSCRFLKAISRWISHVQGKRWHHPEWKMLYCGSVKSNSPAGPHTDWSCWPLEPPPKSTAPSTEDSSGF